MRLCTKCKELKDLQAFPFHKRHSTGLSSWCKMCHSVYCKAYYTKHKKYMLDRAKQYTAELRLTVLSYYSDGTLACLCCKESTYEFLSLDHIYGGGTEHRKETGAGSLFYGWLIKNNLPDGYRVLCHNCNMSRGQYGYCPHEKNNENTDSK